jgi:hypothetical protein
MLYSCFTHTLIKKKRRANITTSIARSVILERDSVTVFVFVRESGAWDVGEGSTFFLTAFFPQVSYYLFMRMLC